MEAKLEKRGRHEIKPGEPGYAGDMSVKFDINEARVKILALKAMARETLKQSATEIGTLLFEARQALGEVKAGEFYRSCQMSPRVAQQYMQLAELSGIPGADELPKWRGRELFALYSGNEIEEIGKDGMVSFSDGTSMKLEDLASIPGDEFRAKMQSLKRVINNQEKTILDQTKSNKRETDKMRGEIETLRTRLQSMETGDPDATIQSLEFHLENAKSALQRVLLDDLETAEALQLWDALKAGLDPILFWKRESLLPLVMESLAANNADENKI